MVLVSKKRVAWALAKCALRSVDRRWLALVGGAAAAAAAAVVTTVTVVKLRDRD